MRILSAKWGKYSEEGSIKFAQDFQESDWLLKLDALKDLIGILEREYENLLELEFNERNMYQLKGE